MRTFLHHLLIPGTLACLIQVAVPRNFEADPGIEAEPAAQITADHLRAAAETDIAFIAAGHLKRSFQTENLATLPEFPTDEVAVVTLMGSQIRAALERSVSLYPSSNASFLQISGLEVSFSKGAPPNKRIQSVTINGEKLDNIKEYSAAMPLTLAKGGLGYFKVWDKSQISRTVEGVTLESILKGKVAGESASRWTALP